MSVSTPSFKAPLFLFVSVLAFGLGMVLVIGAQRTTENRSRASGDGPYNCSLLCGPPSGSLTSAVCQQCLSAGGTVVLVNGSGCSMDALPEAPVSCQNCPGDFYINESGRPTCGTQPSITPVLPQESSWADCQQWNAQNICIRTYWQLTEEDWRCSKRWEYLNMCSVELPDAPRPEEDPGLNP